MLHLVQTTATTGGLQVDETRDDGLCAVTDCTADGRPQVCPYDGRYHHHGRIHYENDHRMAPRTHVQEWRVAADLRSAHGGHQGSRERASAGVALRRCVVCGRSLPENSRSDRRTCSAKCRVALSRRLRATAQKEPKS